MTNLAHAQAAIELSSGCVGPRHDLSGNNETKLLIAVDPREFSRGCLISWLKNLGEEFTVLGAAEVGHVVRPDQLARASAVILSVGLRATGETWLERQVAFLREQVPEIPIVAILEPEDAQKGEEMVGRLYLQGHIPTSSTPEIARAALQLIFVGGTYSPRVPRAGVRVAEPGTGAPEPAELAGPKITPREARVLELLMQGMANKIIAYRLGMSQSTVKVHVHNIIKKLNVRNRTEAAVSARRILRFTVTSSD